MQANRENNRIKYDIYILRFLLVLSIFILMICSGCGRDELEITTSGDGEKVELAEDEKSSEEGYSDNSSKRRSSSDEGEPDSGNLSGKNSSDDKTSSENNGSENTGSGDRASSNDISSDEESHENKVSVYICGAVCNEGVYELNPDCRIQDALKMAGGYTDDAVRGYINLAEKLVDGERIYFPHEGELDDTSVMKETSNPQYLGVPEAVNSDGTEKINLNTADKETLMKLSGIGERKAEDIIAYRESHGGFTSIDELTNVSGIGSSTFSKLEDMITVE